jgi:hypothetical protein
MLLGVALGMPPPPSSWGQLPPSNHQLSVHDGFRSAGRQRFLLLVLQDLEPSRHLEELRQACEVLLRGRLVRHILLPAGPRQQPRLAKDASNTFRALLVSPAFGREMSSRLWQRVHRACCAKPLAQRDKLGPTWQARDKINGTNLLLLGTHDRKLRPSLADVPRSYASDVCQPIPARKS